MPKQESAWVREYLRTGTDRIESSYTPVPAPCIDWFRSRLDRQGIVAGQLLDLGCGRGRNSLPFLQDGWAVAGVDVAEPALRDFQKAARGLPGCLTPILRDMGKPLPMPDRTFDAVQEITAADNLVNLRIRERFFREIARVLKPGGLFLTCHFTPQDGWYGPLLAASPRRQRGILYDRAAGMHFRFYRADDVVAATRGRLQIRETLPIRQAGPMFGRILERVLVATILSRTDG